MNWKKSVICFVSFLASFFGEVTINVACGPQPDPYDYYISYFHPNVQGDQYTAFSFNEMVYLYRSEEAENEPEINSSEWAEYLNVKKDDVFNVMYNTDSVTEHTLANLTEKSFASLPDTLKQNSFLSGLKNNKAALKYFVFAKSCEPYTKSYYDSWDPVARDSTIIDTKAAEAIALTEAENNSFFKLRYAFQAVRMYRYGGNLEACMHTYEKFIEPVPSKSAVKGWALSLYAGAVRFSGYPAKSAYLFSKVFTISPERRVQAYKDFFHCSSSLDSVLAFTKSDSEKASVLAINSFGNSTPDVESLQKVYQYNPASLLNGALLIREVNKLEQNLIKESNISESYYAGYFARNSSRSEEKAKDSIDDVYLKHLLKIKHFAVRLAAEKKYPYPELGTLTAAYLSWMEHKDAQALSYLATLNANKLPARLRDQYRITELLVKGNQIKKGSTFNENELLPALKWLDEKRFLENSIQPNDQNYYDSNWANGENLFTITTRNFYQQVLAPAYVKMGDTAKAAMAMLKGDAKYKTVSPGSFNKNMSYQTLSFWQNRLGPKTMSTLAAFKAGPKTGSLKNWLSNGLNKLSKDDFNELFGTTYLRAHQYAKAISCFNRVSSSYTYYNTTNNWYSSVDNEKLHANAFADCISDYPKKYSKEAPDLNKKTFSREMLRLLKLTQSDKKNAAYYYYKMANGVYQTGYYGNSWFLISYEWNSSENYNEPRFSYDVDNKLAQTAKIWYLKARALTRNANLKAKCTFMLAKCEQKKIINDGYKKIDRYEDDYKTYYNKFMALNYNNPYFKEMKLKYSKTPFYKIAAHECSYFGEFLDSFKD